MVFRNIWNAFIKYLGEELMISDKEKTKIKEEIVEKINSVLEKNNE